jgi:hypothetical protein
MPDNIFPDKFMKKIVDIPDFVDGVSAAETDDIKKKILHIEGGLYEIDNAKEADQELTDAREKVKDLAKPYRESKGIETAKLKYCLYILESRGINL